jgi:hypothetical protein
VIAVYWICIFNIWILYIAHIHARISLYQINTNRCTLVLLGHHSVITIRYSNMLQHLKGHLQGVHLIHSYCMHVLCTVAAICCGTRYTPHVKLNCTFGDLFYWPFAWIYQMYSLKVTFKGWNMLEFRIVLIEWWPNNVWVRLLVFLWYIWILIIW